MSQIEDGPINLNYGDTALFTIEFYDPDGETDLTVGEAFLSLVYTDYTTSERENETVELDPVNGFFSGTWSSSSASPGTVLWAVLPSSNSTIAQVGTLRVMGPGEDSDFDVRAIAKGIKGKGARVSVVISSSARPSKSSRNRRGGFQASAFQPSAFQTRTGII